MVTLILPGWIAEMANVSINAILTLFVRRDRMDYMENGSPLARKDR